jgi:hypothetical protein
MLEVLLHESEANFDKERNSLTSSTENRLVEEIKNRQKGQNDTYHHLIEVHWNTEENWQTNHWEVLVPQNTPQSNQSRSMSMKSNIL